MNKNEILSRLHERAMDEIHDALIRLQDDTLEVGEIPHRCDDWHEDDGSVLWWNVEHTGGEIVEGPSYVGGPTSSDWPFETEDEPHLLWVQLPKLARSKP